MAKKLFITGTGTDIGKTFISALIVKAMREAGYNCGYYKPVLSGVEEDNGVLTKSDCNYVIDISKTPQTPNDCVSYWWKEAVSPHLASKRQGQKVEISKIVNDLNNIEKSFEYLLIEGAGGITCPIILNNNCQYLMKDLILELNCEVLIVADAGLGTLNSVILTVEYAKKYNISIKGIVLNNFDNSNFMHKDNLAQVKNLTGIQVIDTIKKNQNNIKLLESIFS